MQSRSIFPSISRQFKVGFAILALLLSACSGQSPIPVATQTSTASVPVTGLASPTAQPGVTSQSTAAPSTPTPAATSVCTMPAPLTPAVTEGPYFKANSPERASLIETGTAGTRLTLTGYVFTTDCQPVAHALLDFWQANAQGVYDNTGYTLRGHQFTDANGRYQLDTVIPGIYTGRTEHIHVKVQAPKGPILTTQLFFPGVSENQADTIFDPALLITVLKNTDAMQATYTFVINP